LERKDALGGEFAIGFVKDNGNIAAFQAINHPRALAWDISDGCHGGDVMADLDDHVAVHHGGLAGFYLFQGIGEPVPVFGAGEGSDDEAQAFAEMGILELGVFVTHPAFPKAIHDGAHRGVGVGDEDGPNQGLEIEEKVPGGHGIIS